MVRPSLATVRNAPSGSVLRTSVSKRISEGPIESIKEVASARPKIATAENETSSNPSTSATNAAASPPEYESETRRGSSPARTSAIDRAGSEIIVPPGLLPESAITLIDVISCEVLTVANNATGVLKILSVRTSLTLVPLPELRTEL